LSSAGLSSKELEYLIGGPDRGLVRKWLASLPPVLRTVFVLRAVAGFTAAETEELMHAYDRAPAAKWTPEAVREIYRQGLCSLASQLIHDSSAH
jgi:hypothetical protein